MKKSFVTYLLFIVFMSAFIVLRVYAGKALASEMKKDSEYTLETVEVANDTVIEKDLPKEDTEKDNSLPEFDDDSEYLWHGKVEPKVSYEGPLPRIICWGDSLTVSVDEASAYPDILRDMSGCDVVNYGVESENTAMIAMREGGLRVNVKATVIPADVTLIPIFLRTESDGHVFFLDNGDAGINPCAISGIEGELVKLNGSFYFKRSKKGERIAIEEGTQFKTHGMIDAKMGDVLVIFAGTNDLPTAKGAENIIKLERAMLDAAKCEKYVIVGLTYAGGIPEIEEVNAALAKEFGDHFIDIRKYMLYYGLNDLGIEPTESDIADIKKGEIPSSLRSDYVHGNKHYHRLLGQQVYRRMVYLGYLPDEEGPGEEENL